MGKRILVTGAGGYIGRHVVKSLLQRGAEVIATDLNIHSVPPQATALQYDIFSGKQSVYQDLGSPEICIHMAWMDGFVHNSTAHMGFLSKHFLFMKNMIDSGLKQLAVMGTMHEIGYHEGMITETTACHPISMYGIAKNCLRDAMFLLARDKDVVLQWLRAYYICGDDKNNHSVFAKLILAEEAGQTTFPFVSGNKQYDFIEVATLADQIAASTMQTKVKGIIECCSGKPVSLAQKVEDFIASNHYKIHLQYGAFAERESDSPCMYGDNSKITEIMRRDGNPE